MTRRVWGSENQVAVRRFHAPLFRRWKKRMGLVGNSAVADIPGFLDSLQMLHDYGYSLMDIGAVWGVSHERVRQWFVKYGLERVDDERGAALRIWDGDLACFVPVSSAEYRERFKTARRRDRDHAALAADIALVRRLAEELGHPPAIADLSEAIYGRRDVPCSGPAARWGWNNNPGGDCSYSEAMDRLYDAAGVVRPTHAESQRRRWRAA